MRTVAVLILLSVSAAASQYTYDVTTFGGAKCDGVTDDTAAIQKTINAAAAAITRSGANGGPIYFPPSSGFCKVTKITFPSMNQGWLVSLFNNGVYASTIQVGSNNAYIGQTSSYAGLSGGFLDGPTSEWQQTGSAGVPLVDIAGVTQVYFEGLNMQTQTSSGTEVVHIHDVSSAGSTYLNFKRCVWGTSSGQGSAIVVDSSQSNIIAGFGLKISESSTALPISITNMGQVTIADSFIYKIKMTNSGISSDGDLELNNVLSEGLVNDDFLTINQASGQVSDITLRRVKMADATNSYMIKNLSPKNFVTNVLVEMSPLGNYGKGLVDPTSSNYLMAMTCIGNGCQASLSLTPAWRAFYDFEGFTSQGKILYGSQYVPQPLQ